MSIRERQSCQLIYVEGTKPTSDGKRSTVIRHKIARHLRFDEVPAAVRADLSPNETANLRQILARNEPKPDRHIRLVRYATDGALQEIAAAKAAPDGASGVLICASLEGLLADLDRLRKTASSLRRQQRKRSDPVA